MKNKDLPKKKYCFFVTPIGKEHSDSYKKMTAIEENIIKPLLEREGYSLEIAHKIENMGSISDQIFKYIVNADLVISNLTDLNANVMYETAVAHSFDIPTIMITEDIESLPFDLKMDRSVQFANTIEGSGHLKNELESKIKSVISSQEFDNPIKRAVERVATKEKLSGDTSPDAQIIKMLVEIQDRLYSVENRSNSLYRYESEKYRRSPYKYESLLDSGVELTFSDVLSSAEISLIKSAVGNLKENDIPITMKNIAKITDIDVDRINENAVIVRRNNTKDS